MMSRSTPYTSLAGAVALISVFLLASWTQVNDTVLANPEVEDHAHHQQSPSLRGYTRSLERYQLPPVSLVGMNGAEVPLGEALDHPGPLLLQFIFTTCPGVCPALSAIFTGTQNHLGEEVEGARFISISIDPEHDTPQRLRDYAHRFDASHQWKFFTGDLEDVIAVQKAFAAYHGNKMRHEPVTFLRPSPGDEWIRFDGFPRASDLANEVRRLQR